MSSKHSIHIEAPVEKVFDFFRDPGNYSELGGPGAPKEVHVTKEGVGTYWVGAPIRGLPMEIFDVYTEFVPNQRITEWSSFAPAGKVTYTFEPEGSGTKLTWEIHPRSFWRLPLLRELAQWGMAKTSDLYMSAFKAKLEASPGAKPKAKTAA